MSMNQSPETFIHSSMAGDEVMSELVELFVNDIPDRIQALRGAFEARDSELLNRTAHQLKGAFGSYGFEALTEPAAQLEKSSLTFPDGVKRIEADLNALAELCQRLSSEPAPNSPLFG
jgi:histidine phosphotransfer protein HptB